MKRKNIITLLFLVIAFALWGLATSKKDDGKNKLAKSIVPTAFADIPTAPPPGSSGESGSDSGSGCEGSSCG